MRTVEISDLRTKATGDGAMNTALKKKIREAVESVLKEEDVTDCNLSIAITDDQQIREINQQFLGRDNPTDVISFNLTDKQDNGLTGEIVVSAERAQEVAKSRNCPSEIELLLYVVHGCLHLLDYDDQSPEDARRMHTRENEILSLLGYPDAYGDPSQDQSGG